MAKLTQQLYALDQLGARWALNWNWDRDQALSMIPFDDDTWCQPDAGIPA